MTSLSRRRLLSIGAVGAVAGLAGCSALLQDDSPRTQWGGLSVTNYDHEPHAVTVLVMKGGDPVYRKSREVPDATHDDAGYVDFEGVPTRPGDSHLYVRVDSREYTERYHRDLGDFETYCLEFDFLIERDHSEDELEFRLLHGTDLGYCDTTPTALRGPDTPTEDGDISGRGME